MTVMRVAVAQLRNVVGDLEGNAAGVADAMEWAERSGAAVLVLPELALTGYPVGDLVLHREFVKLGEGIEDLVADGLDAGVVLDVLARIDRAELTRRHMPLGVTIRPRAFGTDRRMPISNGWRPHRREDVDASPGPRLRLEPETAGVLTPGAFGIDS